MRLATVLLPAWARNLSEDGVEANPRNTTVINSRHYYGGEDGRSRDWLAEYLAMVINPHFIVHETDHWILNHHLSSALPGYLMLGAKVQTASLSELAPEALAELGGLLARIQELVERQLQPKHLYISRFGHQPGLPVHFHFIPVYPWVEDLFWNDESYRLLETFGCAQNASTLTDGAELTLFIWREFGERPEPPEILGPSIRQVIDELRTAFA